MVKRFIILSAIGFTIMTADQSLAIGPADPSMPMKLNIAGKQRALAERIGKAACFTHLAAEMEYHRDLQISASEEFRAALRTLTEGDDELGVPEERSEAVLEGVSRVRSKWVDLERALLAFNGTALPVKRQFVAVVEGAYDLRKEADGLVQIYLKESGKTDVDEGNLARTINIAGRQRMLIQHASKDVCLLALRIDVEETRRELGESLDLFEATLDRLIEGDEKAGIVPPVSSKHKSQLERVRQFWRLMEPHYRNAQFKPEMHHFDYLAVANLNDALMNEMDRAVAGYVD